MKSSQSSAPRSCRWPRSVARLVVACSLVMTVVGGTGTAPASVEELSVGLFDSVSFPVSHVAVDRDTGRLYVGALNRLYELSPQLDPLSEVRACTAPLIVFISPQ